MGHSGIKVAILAGGMGTRLSEVTEVRPKPMVEICGRPIFWHLMKHSAHYGMREFVVELGYKGECIQRLKEHLGAGTFMLTWGDGLSNVDLEQRLAFHRGRGKLATITAVRPPARFGKLDLEGERAARFTEKPQLDQGWINGAFFVLEQEVFGYIDGDETSFERGPPERLASEGRLMAFKHDSFRPCMDTLRDRKRLEQLWEGGNAPWKVWNIS